MKLVFSRGKAAFLKRAAQLKTDLPAVFMALRDGRTPWPAKLLAALTVGYALSPIDLIPDFIPVLGYLDDVLLLPLLIACTLRCIPAQVLADCRKQAADLQQIDRPRRWYCAMPVVLIWALLLFWAARAFGFL